MNRYRRQTIRMKTDHHDVDGEPVEIAIPLYMAGLMAAFHKLLDTPHAEKTERMRQLQELMWMNRPGNPGGSVV